MIVCPYTDFEKNLFRAVKKMVYVSDLCSVLSAACLAAYRNHKNFAFNHLTSF